MGVRGPWSILGEVNSREDEFERCGCGDTLLIGSGGSGGAASYMTESFIIIYYY